MKLGKRYIFNMLSAGLAMAGCALFGAVDASAQNPYLPLWEYIPDGEPYVFEDPDKPGEYRVYVYGSHDSMISHYCGREQVVWSAPVNNLNDWRYDGIIFISDKDRDGKLLHENGQGDVLYAPDVAMVTEADGSKTYYLYPNNQEGGREGMVAKSKRPDGPFEVCNWSMTNPSVTDGVLRFDPGVFVDDDGKVYAYWGFGKSNGAELDPATMATVKPGTEIVENMIPGLEDKDVYRFYEASSIRKINDKYVFVYSRLTDDGEFGLPASNYTLAYAYGDNPLGPFTYGGTIIDGRGRGTDEDGNVIATAYPAGNTHGSICEIDGKWWVFYHRQTGTNEFSRQAMVAPIEVEVEEGSGGKVKISEGEFTSEGFMTEGLNPLYKTPAGLACYFVGPEKSYNKWPEFFFSGSYIKPTYFNPASCEGPFNEKMPFDPVVNNTAGSTVGYKYFDFSKIDEKKPMEFVCHLVPEGVEGTVTLLVGSPYRSKGGKEIGSFRIGGSNVGVGSSAGSGGSNVGVGSETGSDGSNVGVGSETGADGSNVGGLVEVRTPLYGLEGLNGKQALYLLFDSDVKGKSICELYDFRFAEQGK